MKPINAAQLIEAYDTILLDAYGVLLDGSSALPHAISFIDFLNRSGKDYFIVTNGASTSLEGLSRRYHGHGLKVAPERIISSGSLLAAHLEGAGLMRRPTFATGPESSFVYLRDLGLELVTELADIERAEQVIVMDEPDADFIGVAEVIFNKVSDDILQGKTPSLIVPNPDLLFPARPGYYQFTSGAFVQVIEQGLSLRFPTSSLAQDFHDPVLGMQKHFFVRLGKPFPSIFEAARKRASGKTMVMVGDQLLTDILGANSAGIDSALLLSGTIQGHETSYPALRPKLTLSSLAL